MFLVFLYLTTIFFAPQLWVEPFVGLPVDAIIYPIWFMVIFATNRDGLKLVSIDKLILGFIAVVFISSLLNGFQTASGGRPGSIDFVIRYIKYFVLFKLLIATVTDEKKLHSLIKMIVFWGAVLVVEGIMHKHSADHIGWAGQKLGWVDPSVIAAGGSGRTKWIGIFDGPGVFGVVYIIILPFIMRYLFKPFSGGVRFLALCLLAAVFLAIYYNGSRGSFLAVIGILGLQAVFIYKISISKILTFGGLLIALYVAAPSHLTQVKDEKGSAQDRVDMWAQGIEMLEMDPIFGIGRGNYIRYTGKLIAHNSAIEIMGETGSLGFFFWVAMLYLCFKNMYVFGVERKKIGDDRGLALARAAALSLAGYLICSMFVTLEYVTMYILMAIGIILGNLSGKKVELDGRDKKFVVGIIVTWIMVLKVFFTVYY